jgi:hypothetical protein
MSARFAFYEVVSVLPCELVPERLWGTSGAVVGRADSTTVDWEYAVQMFSDANQCWQLPEACLRSEGRVMKREDLYDGTTISIGTAPAIETGSGKK